MRKVAGGKNLFKSFFFLAAFVMIASYPVLLHLGAPSVCSHSPPVFGERG